MLTISLISHGHGEMIWKLANQLVACPEVTQLIVTLNIPEPEPNHLQDKIFIIRNSSPKGFGANHNAAFALSRNKYFGVVNPDIELQSNPFEVLLKCFDNKRVGLVSPLVVNSSHAIEDSMRRFLTPSSILMRLSRYDLGTYDVKAGLPDFFPEWVAGMFMIFRSSVYEDLNGFDERYFMYCEDADICTRLWKADYLVKACLSACVIHNAQRASHRSFKHLSWHICSMVRYFFSHSFSLPKNKILIDAD